MTYLEAARTILTAAGQPLHYAEITRRALEILERTVGETHFEIARCLINFGDALREAGEHEESLAVARRGLEVAAVQIELNTPESVRAGMRFKVQWTGSARSGDFLAVAKIGSSTGDSLDFSFATAGSPSTLAAPFEPGEYEVRYVSGSDLEVVVAAPLTVY